MVQVTRTKPGRIFVYSDCCHKVMTCAESDRVDPEAVWHLFLGESLRLKGHCPYCKSQWTDIIGTTYFSAKFLGTYQGPSVYSKKEVTK